MNIDSSDAKIFLAESPDPVNILPKNSKGDLSPSDTLEIELTLGLISIISELPELPTTLISLE